MVLVFCYFNALILLDIIAPRYLEEFLIDVRFLSWEYNVVVPSPFPS